MADIKQQTEVSEQPIPGHVAEEMYKKNRELAERNKTLSLLRHIDEIVLSAVTDPSQVAKEITRAVVEEGVFSLAAVYRKDRKGQEMTPLAVTTRETPTHLEKALAESISARPLSARKLSSLSGKHNPKGFLKLFVPEDQAQEVANVMGVKALFVNTLKVRREVIGTLVLVAPESVNFMSAYRKNLIERISDVTGIAIDSTLLYQEIQEATARLRVANKNLKALDKTKDEFLSMASHQLRTPLTTIRGYLSMILEGDAGKVSEDQKKFLTYALSGSERMVALISDLLNVSRLSAGRFIIEKEPTDLVKVVEDEVRQLQTHAEQKHLELVFDRPKEKMPLVDIDEGKTRQVLMNFIDNAVYYTKAGGVFVTMEIDDKANTVIVKVRDTGIGVPESAQKKLFTKFFRASNAQAVRPDGTGLGLFLAKRVVEDQGGKILFESTPGKGSIFGFEMPINAIKPSTK